MHLHGSAFLYMLNILFLFTGRDGLGLVTLWPASSGRRGSTIFGCVQMEMVGQNLSR